MEAYQKHGHAARWSSEAFALAAQAKVLSGTKLEQLVVRLQRHSGQRRDACWRFVIRHGIQQQTEHRRWTHEEIELVREDLVRNPIEVIAKKIRRTPKSIRSMLQRHSLRVRDIRCDIFSLESLAQALHVRKSEILVWIERGWLQANLIACERRRQFTITPESLESLYKHHLPELLKRGIPNQCLFEAYVQYLHSPKHTCGEQLLDVRRDKRELAAYEADQTDPKQSAESEGLIESYGDRAGTFRGSPVLAKSNRNSARGRRSESRL